MRFIIDEVNDAKLLAVAAERMANLDPDALITAEELYRELGITEEDLESVGEVEIEISPLSQDKHNT